MENIQGYEIERSVLFENNRGFALGHNPAAPQPYVTWQFTENEGGVRDYYWGHYINKWEAALADYHRRLLEHFERIEKTGGGVRPF